MGTGEGIGIVCRVEGFYKRVLFPPKPLPPTPLTYFPKIIRRRFPWRTRVFVGFQFLCAHTNVCYVISQGVPRGRGLTRNNKKGCRHNIKGCVAMGLMGAGGLEAPGRGYQLVYIKSYTAYITVFRHILRYSGHYGYSGHNGYSRHYGF